MKGWLLLVVSIFTAGIGMLVVGLPGGELTDAALKGGAIIGFLAPSIVYLGNHLK